MASTPPASSAATRSPSRSTSTSTRAASTASDVVVSNPPFSLDKWPVAAFEKDGFRRTAALVREGEKALDYVPPRSRADFAFVLQVVASLTETGRAGIVVPNGVLFRGGAEGRIRRRLVEQNLVKAVVALPEKLFHGTGIPAALLLLDRARATTDVLFVDATTRFVAGTRQNESPSHRDRARRARPPRRHRGRLRRLRDRAGFAFRATAEEVAANDFNLNVARYVRPTEDATEAVDLAALDAEIDAVEADWPACVPN